VDVIMEVWFFYHGSLYKQPPNPVHWVQTLYAGILDFLNASVFLGVFFLKVVLIYEMLLNYSIYYCVC
jgi:hypothetical protein